MKAHRGSRCKALPFNLCIRQGGYLTSRPGRFTPGNEPVPTVEEVGWAPGPVWTDVEKLALTGIRSQDRPAGSKSLYRLRYPGQHSQTANRKTNVSVYCPYSL
jgi:hypothetical protein